MNNISTSVTRIAQLVGEPLGNFLRPVPDFSENHAEAQFSNRINSLAPVASQVFSQKPYRSSQKPCGFTHNPETRLIP